MAEKTNSQMLGERIKSRREALGMSQEELAKKVGYTSRTTIVKIEKGENNLRQTKIVEFAKALECEPTWLIGLDKPQTPEYVPGTAEVALLFCQITEEQRQIVLNLLRSMVSGS